MICGYKFWTPTGNSNFWPGLLSTNRSVLETATTVGCHKSTVCHVTAWAKERNGDMNTIKGTGGETATITKLFLCIIRKRIRRNPTISGRALAQDDGASLDQMQSAITQARFKSMTRLMLQIVPGQKARLLERARWLLECRADDRNSRTRVRWTGEKMFLVQEHLNKTNARILMPVVAEDTTLRNFVKCKSPTQMMGSELWPQMAKSYTHQLPPLTMNVNCLNCQQVVLMRRTEWSRMMWLSGPAVLMQNGAPAHMSRSMYSACSK